MLDYHNRMCSLVACTLHVRQGLPANFRPVFSCLCCPFNLCYGLANSIRSSTDCDAATEDNAVSTASSKEPGQDVEYGRVPPQETETSHKASNNPPWHAAVLCGIINGIITVPVMTSFAAIIFQVRQVMSFSSDMHFSARTLQLQHVVAV